MKILTTPVPPSKENCYRVSKENSYTLKLINPYAIYKNYEINDDLIYYVIMKPILDTDSLNFKAEINNYNTNERNHEGINNVVTIDGDGEYSTILTAPKDKDLAIFTQIQ